jgi:hypothetical protein
MAAVEFDIDELRALLQEETEEAFRLADDLAHEFAAGGRSPVKLAELAALYLQQRQHVRQLKTALCLEVAG